MGVGTLGRHEFIVFAMIHSVGEGIKTRDLFRSGGIKGETGDETCLCMCWSPPSPSALVSEL
jgi:hypothetical protein